MHDDRRLVYSTDATIKIDEPFERKRAAVPKAPPALPQDGVVRVGAEKRRGGQVTLIYGLEPRELDTVANELKKRCGTGGTVKDGIVSLQGDKRTAALAYFAERGRRVKKMGG
jgi:translation initiation factor 1